MISASEIMKAKKPEMLFSKDNITLEFKKLAFQWHPDKNKDPEATNVFAHINKLYKQGLERIKNNCWDIPFFESIKDIDGKRYNIKYRYQFTFELGRCLVCDTNVVYLIDKSYKKFFNNFVNVVSNFSYPSDRVRDEISRFLPSIKVKLETDDNYIIIIPKSSDVIPLRVMYEYFDNKIDPKHVAWILGCLYNLSCWFEVSGITHNDINLDTCFVSPEHHSILIYGGWWYSVPVGQKMIGTSAGSFDLMSDKQRSEKIGNKLFDRRLINAVGLELLGDITGSSLLMNKNIPSKFTNWLIFPDKCGNINYYKKWMDTVVDIFGERRFIKIDETVEMMYDKINDRSN